MPEIFSLQFPQSLGVFDAYADAQKAVDYLSDEEFPVENCLIVGTDLKQVERVTGRLSTGRVALAGVGSGVWFGLFFGVLLALFAPEGEWLQTVAIGVGLGVVFFVAFALFGYWATRGRRDFSSVTKVVATRYEVLVEHKLLARGQELLAKMPGRAQAF